MEKNEKMRDQKKPEEQKQTKTGEGHKEKATIEPSKGGGDQAEDMKLEGGSPEDENPEGTLSLSKPERSQTGSPGESGKLI